MSEDVQIDLVEIENAKIQLRVLKFNKINALLISAAQKSQNILGFFLVPDLKNDTTLTIVEDFSKVLVMKSFDEILDWSIREMKVIHTVYGREYDNEGAIDRDFMIDSVHSFQRNFGDIVI